MTPEDEEFERIMHEQKYKLDSTRAAVVAQDYYWMPIDSATPTNVKILLLGRGGVASLGHYTCRPNETQFWEFWAPLPRMRHGRC
jgi:hypothetical protein